MPARVESDPDVFAVFSFCRSVSEMLSESTVTENNMAQFLGIIEHRTNEVLQQLAALHGAAAASPTPAASRARAAATPGSPGLGATLVSLLGHGPATQHGSESMAAVDPPKVDDYSSVRELALVC